MQLEDGIDRVEWKVGHWVYVLEGDIETPVSTLFTLWGRYFSYWYTTGTGTLRHHRLKAPKRFSQAGFMLVDYCGYFTQWMKIDKHQNKEPRQPRAIFIIFLNLHVCPSILVWEHKSIMNIGSEETRRRHQIIWGWEQNWGPTGVRWESSKCLNCQATSQTPEAMIVQTENSEGWYEN